MSRGASDRRLYDLKTAAQYLGRPVSEVRNLIYSGHLPVIQHGERGKQFVDVRYLEEYVERHKRRTT